MTLAKYAKGKGYTLEQFEKLRKSVSDTAAAILETIKEKYNPDSGMYYPTAEIVDADSELAPYIIYELKGIGVEFRDNGELFRY